MDKIETLCTIDALLTLTRTIIVAVGEKGRPSGEVYALVMSAVDLSSYHRAIALCAAGGILTEEQHVLRLTEKGRGMLADITASAAA